MKEETTINNKVGHLERLFKEVGEQVGEAALEQAQAANEQVRMAVRVTRMQTRFEAFRTVLETIGRQKEEVACRVVSARGPLKELLKHQLGQLERQEQELLDRALKEDEQQQPKLKIAAATKKEEDEPPEGAA